MPYMDNANADRLVNTYADMILRISYMYLKQTSDAEDIVPSFSYTALIVFVISFVFSLAYICSSTFTEFFYRLISRRKNRYLLSLFPKL